MVVWGHFCPLLVPICGRSGPKYDYMCVKIRPLWRTSPMVGSDMELESVLWPFKPSPGTYLVHCRVDLKMVMFKSQNNHWNKFQLNIIDFLFLNFKKMTGTLRQKFNLVDIWHFLIDIWHLTSEHLDILTFKIWTIEHLNI